MRRLADEVAVVLGGSAGIRKTVGLCFEEEGASVLVAAGVKSLCGQTAQLVRDKGGEAFGEFMSVIFRGTFFCRRAVVELRNRSGGGFIIQYVWRLRGIRLSRGR
jgi:hypothetical protein